MCYLRSYPREITKNSERTEVHVGVYQPKKINPRQISSQTRPATMTSQRRCSPPGRRVGVGRCSPDSLSG